LKKNKLTTNKNKSTINKKKNSKGKTKIEIHVKIFNTIIIFTPLNNFFIGEKIVSPFNIYSEFQKNYLKIFSTAIGLPEFIALTIAFVFVVIFVVKAFSINLLLISLAIFVFPSDCNF